MKKIIFPKLSFLDGFRAIGILWVAWLHIWQQSWLSSNVTVFNNYFYLDLFPRTGNLGVELLFFVSGFGLFYSYRKRLFENKRNSPKEYFTRRFRRIVPSYLLSILIILIFFNPFSTFGETIYHLAAHLFFVQNLSMQTFGSINGVFWVLGVEAQFYLIFPLIAKVFNRFSLLTFILMSLLAIFYRQAIQIWQMNNLNFYVNQLPGFLDIYAFGMLSAYILTKEKIINFNNKSFKFFATFFSFFLIIILLKMLVELDNTSSNPDYLALWQISNRQYLGLIFGLISVSLFFSLRFWQRIFANKVLFFISTISYNLFIWHQVIAMQLRNHNFPSFKGNDAHLDPVWQIQYTIITVLLSLIIATLITYLFERPIIKDGALKYFQRIQNILL